MVRPKGDFPSQEAINQLTANLDALSEGFAVLQAFTDSCSKVLAEFLRVQESIRKHQHPLDWDEFLTEFEAHDSMLADLLRRIGVSAFDLGKLELQPASNSDHALLSVFKARVLEFLQDRYKVRFRLRCKNSFNE